MLSLSLLQMKTKQSNRAQNKIINLSGGQKMEPNIRLLARSKATKLNPAVSCKRTKTTCKERLTCLVKTSLVFHLAIFKWRICLKVVIICHRAKIMDLTSQKMIRHLQTKYVRLTRVQSRLNSRM